MIAAILAAGMSNLSAALNALASTSIMDFLPALVSARRTAKQHFLKLARWATVAWGAILFCYWIGRPQLGLRPGSRADHRLHPVWLPARRVPARLVDPTGPGKRRHGRHGWPGSSVMIYVKAFTHIAFTWYVLIGTSATFAAGYLVSFWRASDVGTFNPQHAKLNLRRDLGIWGAAAIVVGTVIGSGIFLVPSTMIKNVGSTWMLFAVWVVGGLLSLFGALSYAELAAALPEAGGEYVYLREAYGPLWGFLYGWTQTWVAKSGSIATLATGFFIYLTNFRPELGGVLTTIPLPLGEGGQPLEIRYGQVLAMAVIGVLGFVNYFGVKVGGDLQIVVTIIKVGLIAAIIVIGLTYGHGNPAHFSASTPAPGGITGFFAALVAALWAYDGWNNVSMVSSEIRQPAAQSAAGFNSRHPRP